MMGKNKKHHLISLALVLVILVLVVVGTTAIIKANNRDEPKTKIIDKNGNTVSPAKTEIIDKNGNKISPIKHDQKNIGH